MEYFFILDLSEIASQPHNIILAIYKLEVLISLDPFSIYSKLWNATVFGTAIKALVLVAVAI